MKAATWLSSIIGGSSRSAAAPRPRCTAFGRPVTGAAHSSSARPAPSGARRAAHGERPGAQVVTRPPHPYLGHQTDVRSHISGRNSTRTRVRPSGTSRHPGGCPVTTPSDPPRRQARRPQNTHRVPDRFPTRFPNWIPKKIVWRDVRRPEIRVSVLGVRSELVLGRGPGRGSGTFFGIRVIPLCAVAMTLRLTPDEQRALRQRADLEGVSMQDAARRAVREYVERGRHRDRVASAGTRIIESHREALDRLGE